MTTTLGSDLAQQWIDAMRRCLEVQGECSGILLQLVSTQISLPDNLPVLATKVDVAGRDIALLSGVEEGTYAQLKARLVADKQKLFASIQQHEALRLLQQTSKWTQAAIDLLLAPKDSPTRRRSMRRKVIKLVGKISLAAIDAANCLAIQAIGWQTED